MCRTLWTIACVVTILIAVGGCPFQGLVYEEDMVAGYAVWATDVIEDAAIVLKDEHGGLVVVPPMVFTYGWNHEFIIAKRRRVDDYGKSTGDAIQWYLIRVQNKRVHGPLTEDEFHNLRTELHVPTDLSFARATRLR